MTHLDRAVQLAGVDANTVISELHPGTDDIDEIIGYDTINRSGGNFPMMTKSMIEAQLSLWDRLPACVNGDPAIAEHSHLGCVAFAIDVNSPHHPKRPFPIFLTPTELHTFRTQQEFVPPKNRLCAFCAIRDNTIAFHLFEVHLAPDPIPSPEKQIWKNHFFNPIRQDEHNPTHGAIDIVSQHEGFHHSHMIIPPLSSATENPGPLIAPILDAASFRFLRWQPSGVVDLSVLQQPNSQHFHQGTSV